MRVTLDLAFEKDLEGYFEGRCELLLSKVGNGSRRVLLEASQDILEESLDQVPKATGTLESSGFFEITGNSKQGFESEIGYGGNGDPVNPITGQPASAYMVVVHEDLMAVHPLGKAKFLEDPLREYIERKYPRTVVRLMAEELAEFL